MCVGSPGRVKIEAPDQIAVSGDGVRRAMRGEDATFTVSAAGVGGNIAVDIAGSVLF